MARTDWIGQTLNGRYQIQELLGKGGMSAVYKANDPKLRRVVAIKLIHEHLSDDPEFVRRFEEEAAAVAQLRHPNLIQVFDFTNDEETYYIVFEYVPGETLEDHLKRTKKAGQQMDIDEVVDIVSKAADGLGYAHEKGLIHRDIKPANIIINLQGNPVIMDFGIAKIMGGTHHTATGAVLGTARYMSPEQVKGERIGPSTDFYSLGVLLFEMLGGRPPFDADSAMTLMMMHMNDPVPDLREIRADVPPDLAAVVNKALAKNSHDRYQTGEEFSEAIRGAVKKDTAVPLVPIVVEPDPSETMVDPITTGMAAAAVGAVPAAVPASPPAAPVPAAPPPSQPSAGSRPLLFGVGAVILLIILAMGAWAVIFRDSGNGDTVAGGAETDTTPLEAAEPADLEAAAPTIDAAVNEPQETPIAAAPTAADIAAVPTTAIGSYALPESESDGTITYTFDGRVYRFAVQEGAIPEDISQALDQLSPGGSDGLLNISPDGNWLVLETDRFDPDCVDWACLAIVSADLSTGDVVRANGQLVHHEGFSAVASGGNLIVYGAGDGPHERDLWAVTREGDSWAAPLLLTAESPHEFNRQPALSDDGSKLVFNCGPESYAGEGSAICEVGSDGAAFRMLLTESDGPAGLPVTGVPHHPDYAPDGSIVFEGDWGGEQIWRLPPGAVEPVLVTDAFNNDNSPCVLPNGRIVSLWLDRPQGNGLHEFKVMAADGSDFAMILPGVDVLDDGIGCAS